MSRNIVAGAVSAADFKHWQQASVSLQEPRCPASQNGTPCPGPITAFYQDLSQYLKSINPNQLVCQHLKSNFYCRDKHC